jgi:hypothetical protein
MSDDPLETAGGTVATTSQSPRVVADFSGYMPPFDPVPIVEKMVASVPSKYLIGLKEIVLTNSSGLSRKRRRSVTKARKHKVRIERTGGLYHPAWNGSRAWIEIFVDNILRNWEEGWWLSFGYYREMLLGDVLFHEIGHHIQATVRPEFREQEDVADGWKLRLKRQHFRFRHPFLKAFLTPFQPLLNMLSKAASKYQFKRGWISRGEYEVGFRRPVGPKK